MKTSHLQQIKGIWRVRIVVPPPLVPIVGKAVLLRSTGTHDKRKAKARSASIIAEFQAKIADAHRELYGDDMLGFYCQYEGHLPGEPMPMCADEPPLLPEPIGFWQLVDFWAYRRGSTTPKARQAIEGKINRLTEFLGHNDASRVTANDLARYLRTLVASGLKPNTVDDHIAYLRRIFALAKEAEWITTNPAEHLRRA